MNEHTFKLSQQEVEFLLQMLNKTPVVGVQGMQLALALGQKLSAPFVPQNGASVEVPKPTPKKKEVTDELI